MKYGTVGAGAVVEEELPSPKLKKLFVNSFGGAGRAPRINKNINYLKFIILLGSMEAVKYVLCAQIL